MSSLCLYRPEEEQSEQGFYCIEVSSAPMESMKPDQKDLISSRAYRAAWAESDFSSFEMEIQTTGKVSVKQQT